MTRYVRFCDLINRLLVFGFAGLLLAFYVDFPGLAVATGFIAGIAFFIVEEYVYPRMQFIGPYRTVWRGVLIFAVGELVGLLTLGLPMLWESGLALDSIDVYRTTLGWGSALGVGVGAVGTMLYSFQRAEARAEEQQRLLAETARQAAELRELAARAETQALRAQINPHFLYNALNTLAYLVDEDPPAARRVVQKLASIFRRTLERSYDTMTTLRDELEFTHDYVAIERERFDDVLEVLTFIDPRTLDAKVPAMMLQPLAENAVKHGICPVSQGGTLTVRTSIVEDGTRLRIELSDDGRGMDEHHLKSVLDGSQGVGFNNVRERLRLHYGENAAVTIRSKLNEGTVVTLELPYEAAEVASGVAV
jgi:sensor histidine kinase YesM